MTKDFVRDGMAWLKCNECNAETTIIKYKLVPQYNFPIIDHEETISNMQAFQTKHAICKPVPITQQNLF